jgi:hypothetical protein
MAHEEYAPRRIYGPLIDKPSRRDCNERGRVPQSKSKGLPRLALFVKARIEHRT